MTLKGRRRREASENLHGQDTPIAAQTAGLLLLTVVCMLLVDQPVARWVSSLPPWLRISSLWISEATSPLVVLPLLLGLSAFTMVYAGDRQARASAFGVFGLCAGLAAVFASLLVKHMIGRARPTALHDLDSFLFRPFAFEDAFASLPSAQAALAAAITFSATIYVPQLRVRLIALGTLICSARVVAGEHWPSDVIAGWTLGWLLVLALQFVKSRLLVRSRI